MLIVHIQIHVKPGSVEAFKAATLVNARNSVQEPGISKFDFFQEADGSAKFKLVEHYRDAAAQAAHRESAHYLTWRDTVAPMMAEPRVPVKYNQIFP